MKIGSVWAFFELSIKQSGNDELFGISFSVDRLSC